MGEGPVSSHHHWTDRLLRVVSEQQLSVTAGLYKTQGLPEGTRGLRLGSEGKKVFPFPQDGVGLAWARGFSPGVSREDLPMCGGGQG